MLSIFVTLQPTFKNLITIDLFEELKVISTAVFIYKANNVINNL